MTPEQEALARRLAAHPQFDWDAMPDTPGYWGPPELDDWATAGALLGMLAGSLSAVHRASRPAGDIWHVVYTGRDGRPRSTLTADTLGEACAIALLDVWGEP